MKLMYNTFLILLLPCVLFSQVTGTVFRDYNGNGIKDTNEPLIPGITVNAYNAANTICGTATTSGATAPNYSLTGCGTASVRVEFVLPSSGSCANDAIDYSSMGGALYGTSVQFANGNSTNVNFALHNPGDYNIGTTGVSTFIPCYISGNPLVAGDVADGDWFIGYPYTNTGATTTTPPTQVLNGAIIGPTWGVAYSKQANKIFTSALIKRHVGLGSLGSGGIYMLEPTASSFNVTAFYDLDANSHRTRAAASAPAYGEGTSYAIAADNSTVTYLGSVDALTGKPAGLGVIGTNVQRGLTSDPLDPSYDPAAFDQAGKVGLGDIDISDDGKFLFVMNLYSRKVFRLELDNASNPTAVINVTSYDVPATICANGEYRPWGLKFYRNKLYVGVVCSGENGGTLADVNASVYELNNPTASATFNASALTTVPLDYDRQDIWHPWTNDSEGVLGGGTAISRRYATPLLSDIEFTDNGDMVMGFMDRSGNQWGEANRRFLKTEVTSITISGVGDVLIAGLNCSTGTFAIENDGIITSINGTVLTGSSNLNEGPGGKEFFNDNSNSGDPHEDTTLGGLAILKGQGELFLPGFAQTSNSGDAGTMKLSTTNGSYIVNSFYELYNRNDFTGILAKANGLGDVELSGIEAPIENGNRVWLDTNADGIQDAGETGIAGVQVQLFASNGTTLIATATTDTNGNYIFSNNATGTTNANFIYNLTALQPNTSYVIKFPTTVSGNSLTTVDAGSKNTIDSDANALGEITVLTTDIPTAGANNHTFDVGYTTVVAPPTESCDCKEYIYLNEPDAQSILKFEVVPGQTALVEVTGANGGTAPAQHWYPGLLTPSEMTNPHGLATDLNGNLYVGDVGVNGQLRKFNCDGVLSPVSGSTIQSEGVNQNIFSIGNTIYVNTDGGPTAYNSCTGEKIGQVCLDGAPVSIPATPGTNLWGLSYNPKTEMVYATLRAGTKKVWAFTRQQLEAGIAGSGSCIPSFIAQGANTTVASGENVLPAITDQLFGVTSDNMGNIYLVYGLNGLSTFISKYNSDGEFIANSLPASAGGGKWGNGIGIVWSESTNRLYMSNFTDDPVIDCISAFDAGSLAYIGTAAPNPNMPVNSSGKAISILKECCPINLPSTFQREVCGAVGTKFYLNQEAFDTCDGTVCGSSWTPTSLNNMTFDACDNSVVVNGTGCSTFTLDIGAVSSTGCAAQASTFTICNSVIDAEVTANAGVCTVTGVTNDASILISNILNRLYLQNRFRFITH